MQAIEDHAARMAAVHERMDAAITRIEQKIDAMVGSSGLSEADKQLLNSDMARLEGHEARLNAVAPEQAQPTVN